MPEMQVVVFSLNSEVYGADTFQVKQIVKFQDITRIPQMPRFIEGVINLRGKAIPIINLNKRFELEEAEVTQKTKIIITEISTRFIGFIVDDVIELAKFSEDDIEPVPDLIWQAGNHYIKNVAKRGEKIISIIDLSSILTDSELNKLKNQEKSDS